MFITPNEVKNALPLLLKEEICAARDTICNILHGLDARILLIVGPCSIHNIDAAKDYANRLQRLSCEVEDVFFICMRTYFEKSRTSLGWKGLLYDPFLDGSNSIADGIRLARELLIYLSNIHLPAAIEFLEPLFGPYISDCISWGSIGARTCQSPIHRQLISGLNMPVGIKNRDDGNIDIAIQACLTAREPHHFLGINDSGNICQQVTKGNSLLHLVLRGANTGPNYSSSKIADASKRLKQASLLESIVVDCSHDNSQRDHLQQPKVFSDIITQITSSNSPVKGIMLESFLEEGSTNSVADAFLGRSITDPCLDWQTTEQIIRQGADMLRLHSKVFSCI